MIRVGASLALAFLIALSAGPAWAHWCNNIFTAPSRMVVKPEKPTVFLSGGQSTTLRVYVRNNFPYTLFSLKMRGDASGYNISVSPSSQTALPTQNVSFVLTITPTSGATGNVNVTNLDLQVAFRPGNQFGWQDQNHCHVDQSPSLALLQARSVWGAGGPSNNCGSNQSASLTAAQMADQHPTATLPSGSPTFGRTGMQQLIHFCGYRFCYSSSGSHRSSTACPNPTAEGNPWTSTAQFGQNCMRACAELAARKAQLGSNLQAARDATVNAMAAGSNQHKCIAAVAGAYLWQGASSTSAFTAALSSIPTNCRNAANRILGSGSALSCGNWAYQERAACAAAEGLRNNNGPVTSILMPNAGDGYSPSSATGYAGLFYAYMLRIVSAHRAATGGGVIPFYPDAGAPSADTGTPPTPDQGTPTPDQATPTPDQATPTPDQATPTPDQATPTPDQATPTPDQATPTPDQATPTPDTSTPVDKGTPTDDKGTPTADKGTPTNDTGTPVDKGAPATDKGVSGPKLDGGCVIASGASGQGTGTAALLLALMALVALRRRRD